MIDKFADSAPYPPVEVCGRNPVYARAMLSNIGACNSEISAVSLYFYNSLIAPAEEVRECFHKISIVEMHHLDIYGKLAYMLGADPRLWDLSKRRPVYWSPACNHYPCALKPLLLNAISGEQAAIQKYRCQAQWIKDKHIVAMLDRIILDEERHVCIFKQLYEQYITNGKC